MIHLLTIKKDRHTDSEIQDCLSKASQEAVILKTYEDELSTTAAFVVESESQNNRLADVFKQLSRV